MAKIKSVTQLNLPGKSDSDFSLNDSSAANQDAFSSVLGAAAQTDEAETDTAGQGKSDAQGGNQTGVKASEKSEKSKDGTTSVSQSGKAGEGGVKDTTGSNETDEAELREMENYEITLAQLAEQLNAALCLIQQQGTKSGQVMPEIRLAGGTTIHSVMDFKKIIAGIETHMLRRVDVKSLELQLKKIFRQTEVPEMAVPLTPIQLANPLAELSDGVAEAPMAPVLADLPQSQVVTQPEFEINLAPATTAVAPDPLDLAFAPSVEVAPIVLNAGDTNVTQRTFDEKEFVFLKVTHDAPVSQDGTSAVEATVPSFFSEMQAKRLAEKQDVLTDILHQTILRELDLSHIPSPREYTLQPPAVTLAQRLNARVEQEIKFEVNQTVVEMSRADRSGRTRINIRPPELGHIEIELKVKDKKISARVTASEHDTYELMLRHMPELREILRTEGFVLDQYSARHESAPSFSASAQSQSAFAQSHGQDSGEERNDTDQLRGLNDETIKPRVIKKSASGSINVTV